MANRFTQTKPVSKFVLLASAVAGLVVGGGVGKQFFACAEASYPACYQNMVKNGFNLYEGATYAADFAWDEAGTLTVKGSTNVLCPVDVLVAISNRTENSETTQLAETLVPANDGKFTAVFEGIERPKAGELFAEFSAYANAAPFSIHKAVGAEAISYPAFIKVE